jgi:hypothetical protein
MFLSLLSGARLAWHGAFHWLIGRELGVQRLSSCLTCLSASLSFFDTVIHILTVPCMGSEPTTLLNLHFLVSKLCVSIASPINNSRVCDWGARGRNLLLVTAAEC